MLVNVNHDALDNAIDLFLSEEDFEDGLPLDNKIDSEKFMSAAYEVLNAAIVYQTMARELAECKIALSEVSFCLEKILDKRKDWKAEMVLGKHADAIKLAAELDIYNQGGYQWIKKSTYR